MLPYTYSACPILVTCMKTWGGANKFPLLEEIYLGKLSENGSFFCINKSINL